MRTLVTDVTSSVEQWIAAFERALHEKDSALLAELFLADGYFRDNGALTWDYRQFHGLAQFTQLLLDLDANRPRNLRVAKGWPAPHVTADATPFITAFVDFDTTWGGGVAVLSAVPDGSVPSEIRARALFTRLEGVHDPEPAHDPNAHRPLATVDPEPWWEYRARRRQFLDAEPEVLVVGAGQAGLMTAAHLDHLNVATLVIDRNARVGDNWRLRYASLYLHNPTAMNGFPFLPYPEHLPEYLPKDVVGDWLETYARYLDLNVWTEIEFTGATYDDAAGHWRATVCGADGSTRELYPKHIVQTTGVTAGKANVAKLDGIERFAGDVLHSTQFPGADTYAKGAAIVVGMGSSGHDIALDLYQRGFEVTMVQRSPVLVQNVDTANLAYAAYFDGVTPTEVVDIQYGVGLINPLRIAASKAYHQFAKEKDAELLEGLRKAGVILGDGPDGAGWLAEYLRTGGGYYLDVGASDVIVEGGIKVVQLSSITDFIEEGAQLDDGSVLKADLVVIASGYQNRIVEVAAQFGTDVADKLGAIARLDSEGEWTNMWRPTAQRGLWFNGGGINQVRPNSKVMALLIKADLLGLVPDAVHDEHEVMPLEIGARQ